MSSRVTVRRVQIAFVLGLFALTFTLLQWFGQRQKSATFDEPIHLASGYAALAKSDYRFEGTHPPFMRMWAALPLLFMGDVRLDTSVIDRTPPREWVSGDTAFTHATKFLYIDNDANRLLNAARFMIVLCGIGLGILVFAARAGTCITPRRIAALVPTLAVAAVAAIWSVYGFRYAPSGSAAWVLSLETASLAQTVPALARLTSWIDHHHLLPNMFTEGFLIF